MKQEDFADDFEQIEEEQRREEELELREREEQDRLAEEQRQEELWRLDEQEMRLLEERLEQEQLEEAEREQERLDEEQLIEEEQRLLDELERFLEEEDVNKMDRAFEKEQERQAQLDEDTRRKLEGEIGNPTMCSEDEWLLGELENIFPEKSREEIERIFNMNLELESQLEEKLLSELENELEKSSRQDGASGGWQSVRDYRALRDMWITSRDTGIALDYDSLNPEEVKMIELWEQDQNRAIVDLNRGDSIGNPRLKKIDSSKYIDSELDELYKAFNSPEVQEPANHSYLNYHEMESTDGAGIRNYDSLKEAWFAARESGSSLNHDSLTFTEHQLVRFWDREVEAWPEGERTGYEFIRKERKEMVQEKIDGMAPERAAELYSKWLDGDINSEELTKVEKYVTDSWTHERTIQSEFRKSIALGYDRETEGHTLYNMSGLRNPHDHHWQDQMHWLNRLEEDLGPVMGDERVDELFGDKESPELFRDMLQSVDKMPQSNPEIEQQNREVERGRDDELWSR